MQPVGSRRWWILFALIAGLAPVVVDPAAVTVALPAVRRELAASRLQLAVVLALPMLALGLLGPLAGRVARVRVTLVLGLALLAAGAAAAAAVDTLRALLLARLVMAVGAALALPAGLAVVTGTFEAAERGRALAIWAGFTGLGAAVGAPLAGLLADRFGWASVFAVDATLAAAGMLAAALLVRPLKGNAATARGGGLGALPVYLVLAGTGFALTFYLQDGRGESAAQAGWLLLLLAVAFSVAAPRTPVGVRPVGAGGLLAAAAALAGLATLRPGTTLGAVELLVLVEGAGLGIAVAAVAEQNSRFGTPLRALAAAVGVLAAGALSLPTAALAGAAGLALISVALAAPRRRRPSRATPGPPGPPGPAGPPGPPPRASGT